jgi:hypothetical protein
MEAYIIELQEQLAVQLKAVNTDTSVKGYDKMIELVEEAITALRRYIHHHPLTDQATQIPYFRHWAPSFFQQQIYFSECYNLEITRITSIDPLNTISYLEKAKDRIKSFLESHKDLYLYYKMERHDKDEELFVNLPPSKSDTFLSVDEFYCENSIILSRMMAFEKLWSELMRIENANIPDPRLTLTHKYEWNPTPGETAEIIYSFFFGKCISVDGEVADIKDVVQLFKDVFGLDLANIYDTHYSNRRRKIDKAPYLRSMLDNYLSKC